MADCLLFFFLALWGLFCLLVFVLQTADIDEKAIRKEKPEDLVMALAEAKVQSLFIFEFDIFVRFHMWLCFELSKWHNLL